MYEFSTDWFSHAVPLWAKTFATLKFDVNSALRILEVGSFEGRSACWISDHLLDHPGSFLTCVDTFEGSREHEGIDGLYERFTQNISRSRNASKIVIRRGRSQDILGDLISDDARFDLAYIDGSHETNDVISDGRLAYRLLRDRGVLIFDDYEWVHPLSNAQSVREAVMCLEQELAIAVVSSGWQRSYVKL